MTFDVSSFLGGNWLTHVDLPTPQQVWIVRDVKQELVGDDQKIVVYFSEHQKGLGLNKTNLRRIVGLFSADAGAWIGRQLLVYRSTTSYQGQTKLCVRVCGHNQAPPDVICDAQGIAVMYQPLPTQQPVSPPQAATAPQPPSVQQPPAAAPQPTPPQTSPWEQSEGSPPSA